MTRDVALGSSSKSEGRGGRSGDVSEKGARDDVAEEASSGS